MRARLFGCVIVTVSVLTASVSFVEAGSGKENETGTVESTVRDIDKKQQTVYLMNGTLLWTNDQKVLDQLAPGTRVRAAYEDRGSGRKFINRLEVVPAE